MFFAHFISGFFNFRRSARIFYGNLDPKLTRAIKASTRAKTLSNLLNMKLMISLFKLTYLML